MVGISSRRVFTIADPPEVVRQRLVHALRTGATAVLDWWDEPFTFRGEIQANTFRITRRTRRPGELFVVSGSLVARDSGTEVAITISLSGFAVYALSAWALLGIGLLVYLPFSSGPPVDRGVYFILALATVLPFFTQLPWAWLVEAVRLERALGLVLRGQNR